MSDIEPVRHEPKKLAGRGRQQRHVEIEIAGFERGIRAAVLHLERIGHHRAALVLRTAFKLQGRSREDRRRLR
jgi:hypothetical protein